MDSTVLYHFMNERYALESIRDKRLKVALIDELNDPFEFQGISVPEEFLGGLERTKMRFSRKFGILCLSEAWNEPLMWSHYSDSHHGIVLGLVAKTEAARESLSRVNYQAEKDDISRYLDEQGNLSDDLGKFIGLTKGSQWSYEREVRFFLGLEERDPVNGHFFFEYGKDFDLAEIIVGSRASVSKERIDSVLRNTGFRPTIWKAETSSVQFQMDRVVFR